MIGFIRKHPVICVIAFIALCLLPVMTTRDFTFMNELRYLEITDELQESGGAFTLTNNGVPYSDKPPLFFWFMSVSKAIAGKHSILLLSLLAFIPSMVTIAVMDKWLMIASEEAGEKVSASARAATALTLGTTGLFLGTSVFVRMDQMMVMFITLSLFSFYRMFTGKGNVKLHSWLFPIFIFLALFTKGPVGLLAPIITVLCFLLVTGNGKKTGRYLGWKTFGVLLGLSALWFAGILIDGGPTYLYDLTIHQTVGRAFNAFHHKRPFYFYCYAILVVMLPYSLVALPTVTAALFGNKKERTGSEKLFLCAICSIFVTLSLFSSKIHLYLLPIIPFIIYCCPLEIHRRGDKKWMRTLLTVTMALLLVTGLTEFLTLSAGSKIGLVKEMTYKYPFIVSSLSRFACLILSVGCLMGIISLNVRKNQSRAMIYLSVSILLSIYSLSFEMNKVNPYIGYGDLCSNVPADAEVYTMYLKRPENMNVYLGRNIIDCEKDAEEFIDKTSVESGLRHTVLLIDSERFEEDKVLYEYVRQNKGLITKAGPSLMIQFGE